MKTYPTIRNIQINNSSGYVNIPGNTTYSISFSAPGLNNYDYVESAYLYLIIHSYSSDPISKLCLSIGSLESAGTYVVDSIVNNENISSKFFLALFLGSVKALNSFSTGGLSESLELSKSFKNKIIEMFVENIFGAPLDKLLDLLMEKLKWN